MSQSAGKQRPRIGLVLSGGGSRGAYEVGVLDFIRRDLAKRLGRHLPFDFISGTSVGAINGAFLAALCHQPEHQVHALVDAWRSLRIEHLLGLGAFDMVRALRAIVRRDPPPPRPGAYRYGGILDTSGLERFVVKSIPWGQISRNLSRRRMSALSVSATHIGTGQTIVFVHSADPVPVSWSTNPFVRHRGVSIGPRHVLASAAIPLLFPAVKIGSQFYTDGGLRQNMPMSPAIRLGADRILLISLRHLADPGTDDATPERIREREANFPRPLFILGKALNALMLDSTQYDLERMKRLNAVLEVGEDAFGPEYVDIMNRKFTEMRGAPLRRIQAVHIVPSEDIGRIASDFVRSGRARVDSRVARNLLALLADRESSNENDFLSYLLFDGDYAAQLIDLGYRDAARKADELAEFFAGTED